MIRSDVSGRMPARTLPILYLVTAHVSLAVAFAVAGSWPRAVAGFFYHSWLVGLVHLVTLGWITFSILGAIYIVGPVALRMPIAAKRADYVAYACAAIGLVGMVGHFWIAEYAGMAWAAAAIASAVLFMTGRIVTAVRRALIDRAVKLHIALACVNFWIAASMGLLIAFDKVGHFLPGFVLANVFAHAHLAALGWATMMVLGVGYRLLPMVLASKMPSGRSIYASAVLLELGVLGLFTTLLLRSGSARWCGVLVVAGIGVFAGQVAWMVRHRVLRRVDAHAVDFAVLHAAGAGVSLVLAVALGVALLIRPASVQMLRAAAAYGVFGLLGFLGQMIVAMEARLLPMAAWYWGYAGSDDRVAPPSPHAMRDRTLQAVVFAAWTAGVPALAGGMFLESAALVSAGAWTLFAAVVVAAVDTSFVVGRTFRRHDSVFRRHDVPKDWSSAGSHVRGAARAAQ
ncbi:MAG TPA: hypothetical protein VKE51_21370 [Vicinamibacterales bacterium]|nr:hypothetical protein [Vicinamibacterales bacterium]